MSVNSSEPSDSGWAPIAIVLTVLVVALLMGYFFWYAPSQQTNAASPTRNVTINTPASPSSAPSTIVMPSTQGPAGAAGSAGPSGPAGAPGSPGSPGPAGSPGQSGSSSDNGSTGGGQ